MPNDKTGKEGQNGHFGNSFKLENDKNENSSHLLQTSKREKRAGTGESQQKWKNGVLERESLTSL